MVERTPLRDRARGHWKHILAVVGNVDSRHLDGKHHPCPICGGKDRWRFDDKKGEGTSICGQCGARDGVKLVMDLLGVDFPEAAKRIEVIIGTDAKPRDYVDTSEADAAETHKQVLSFWRSGQRVVVGDPVDRYLRRRVGNYPETRAIRCIPSTPFMGRTMPAMITAYVDVAGELSSIQRTFLTADGEKQSDVENDRWNTGPLPAGGADRHRYRHCRGRRDRAERHRHARIARLGGSDGEPITGLAAARGFQRHHRLRRRRHELHRPSRGIRAREPP
jgi:putative DNA primase/helicase